MKKWLIIIELKLKCFRNSNGQEIALCVSWISVTSSLHRLFWWSPFSHPPTCGIYWYIDFEVSDIFSCCSVPWLSAVYLTPYYWLGKCNM